MKEFDIIDLPNKIDINETLNILGDINEIKNSIDNAWVGQNGKKYIANLQKSIVEIQSLLIKLTDSYNNNEEILEESDIDNILN